MRLHAFETHFEYFRAAHYDLMEENTTLAHDLKIAQRKLSQEDALDRIAELEDELAVAQEELKQARAYFATLRQFADEGWAGMKLESSSNSGSSA